MSLVNRDADDVDDVEEEVERKTRFKGETKEIYQGFRESKQEKQSRSRTQMLLSPATMHSPGALGE